MTESRYKIEYIQPEPTKEKNFRFFGAFGYLWLALLASVLIYGIVYKHIPTSEIISYFQNIKTEIVNTDISIPTEPSKEFETMASEESVIYNTKTATENITGNESLENPGNTHKLVSEVINDNQLPEDVVFESEIVEPSTDQTQQEETDSIVSEIIKEQNKQDTLKKATNSPEPTETIESATAAIETELEKKETLDEKKPAAQETITEKVITLEQESVIKNLVKENVVEKTTTEKPTEEKVETVAVSIQMPALEAKTKEVVEKEALVEVKKAPVATLSKLVTDAVSNPNKNDLAYITAITDYEKNKIATNAFLEKIKSQENKASENHSENNTKKPEKSELSAVDAIIAAMNVDKAAKDKPPLSTQENIQAKINLLLKNKDKAPSTSQINN